MATLHGLPSTGNNWLPRWQPVPAPPASSMKAPCWVEGQTPQSGLSIRGAPSVIGGRAEKCLRSTGSPPPRLARGPAVASWSLCAHQVFSAAQETPPGSRTPTCQHRLQFRRWCPKGLCGLRPVGLMDIPGVRPTALHLVPMKHSFMWQNPPVHKVWRKVGGGSWKEVGRKGLSCYAVCQVGSCEKKADLLSQSRVLSWWGLWEQAKPQGMGNPEAKGGWTWLSDVKAICLGEHSRDPSTGVSGPFRGLQRRPIPPKAAKRTSPLGPLPAALL